MPHHAAAAFSVPVDQPVQGPRSLLCAQLAYGSFMEDLRKEKYNGSRQELSCFDAVPHPELEALAVLGKHEGHVGLAVVHHAFSGCFGIHMCVRVESKGERKDSSDEGSCGRRVHLHALVCIER